jgi:hypothetical protein
MLDKNTIKYSIFPATKEDASKIANNIDMMFKYDRQENA